MNNNNILSSDVEIDGSLKCSQDLLIDGTISGDISCGGLLTLGENAQIRGDIKAKAVTVFGKVECNINAEERCELKSTAELVGDIRAGTLAIEEGACFMGASTVGAAAKSSAPAAAPAQPQSPARPQTPGAPAMPSTPKPAGPAPAPAG